MGEGGIKNGQKNSDVFYGWPLKLELLELVSIVGRSSHGKPQRKLIGCTLLPMTQTFFLSGRRGIVIWSDVA